MHFSVPTFHHLFTINVAWAPFFRTGGVLGRLELGSLTRRLKPAKTKKISYDVPVIDLTMIRVSCNKDESRIPRIRLSLPFTRLVTRSNATLLDFPVSSHDRVAGRL